MRDRLIQQETLEWLKHMASLTGYRFEVSQEGTEERMIRPDGTVAVIARNLGAKAQRTK